MGYIRKGILSINDNESILKDVVCKNINEHKIKSGLKATVLGETIHALSDRYKLFFTKGYECCSCGIEGKYFAVEKDEKANQCHLNLYAVKDKKEILMTKDHITPKSKGGRNHISNYQTMCCVCNLKKGSN